MTSSLGAWMEEHFIHAQVRDPAMKFRGQEIPKDRVKLATGCVLFNL